MFFFGHEHKKRWKEAVQSAGGVITDGTIKGDFGASLYILTGMPDVYSMVEKHIHRGYIDFDAMLHMGLSSGETVLVCLAGNLYNGGFFEGYTPADIIEKCDVESIALAVRAIMIRSQRFNINDL